LGKIGIVTLLPKKIKQQQVDKLVECGVGFTLAA
jgi:hypothetical protein